MSKNYKGHWNYRFLLKQANNGDKYYQLIEVFYDDKNNIVAWDESGLSIWEESISGLKLFIKQILKASKLTILAIDNYKLIDTGEYMKRR